MELKKLEAIFNLWAKKYVENPDEFNVDVPNADYGFVCAKYFNELEKEIDMNREEED